MSEEDRSLQQLFAAVINNEDISKSEALEIARQCSSRDLNELIYDLHQYGTDLKHRAYTIFTIIGYISDEVRRRAEELETI